MAFLSTVHLKFIPQGVNTFKYVMEVTGIKSLVKRKY